MPIYRKPEDVDNPLHQLLLEAVPVNKFGNKTLLHLAELIPVNRWSITKWIRAEKLGPERAMRIVEISRITGWDESGKPILGEPRVTKEQLDPFVYNF